MCERDGCCQIFNVITTETSAEAQKECKCQLNFYIKQQQQQQIFQQQQQTQMQSHHAAATTNVNMQPQQQQQQHHQRIHHMQMSANSNNNHNISPTSSHTSSGGGSNTAAASSSPHASHYSYSSDNGGSGASSPTPSATSSSAASSQPPSIGVNLRVTGQCSQGGRKYMEDHFSVAYQQSENAKDLEYAFIGIYDGHGGAEAATFAKEHLMMQIIQQKLFWSDSDEDVLRAIREGYIATHFAMWRDQEKWPKTPNGLPSTAGTTATVAFIRREKIYIGHVGDSGIVLGYQNENEHFWRAKPLTTDHKPESLQERTRIMRSGGKVVVKSGVPRVVWNRPRNAAHRGPIRCTTPVDEIPFLAVARSLGDLWSYNSARNEFVVSPDPDVKVIKINPKTFRCLIFGTDGLWNVVSPQEATDTVFEKETINMRLQAQRGDSPAEGANGQWTNPSKGLVDKALRTWSSKKMRADNTSVVTVILYPPGGYVGCAADAAVNTPPLPRHNPHSYGGLHYTPLNAAMRAAQEVQQITLNDATPYQELAEKYLPPDEFRINNYYQDEEEEEVEGEQPAAPEQREEDPLLLLHHQQHTNYAAVHACAAVGAESSFWGANSSVAEQIYATPQQHVSESSAWHWQDSRANVEPNADAAVPHLAALVSSRVVKTNSKMPLEASLEIAAIAAAEDDESSTDEEDDDEEEDAHDDVEDDADDVSDYETDEGKNYDWGIVLPSTKNPRSTILSKISALTTAHDATPAHEEPHMATTNYSHYNAAMDNAIPAPPAPTYLSSFAESYNSLLSEQMSQETAAAAIAVAPGPATNTTTSSRCSTTCSSSSSSNSKDAGAASYHSLSGSSTMHEILQEQQRYQQQCMSEEDGYSLTKLETRRANASGAGGVQTFKIFQQDAATASYHTPIATTNGGGGDDDSSAASATSSEMWQQRYPAIAAAYARCVPQATTASSAAVKPLELHALLQQERDEEQQVALEQLERQRKLADALAGVSAVSDDDDDEEPPLIEEYLEEELEEIAKVAVQINEISSSSCAEEATAAKAAAQLPPPCDLVNAALLARSTKSNATLSSSSERLERLEISPAEIIVAEAAQPPAAPTLLPPPVHKAALLQSTYAALYKTTPVRRNYSRHKQPAFQHYPNIPNENQQHSISASTHALCTKRARAYAPAATTSSASSHNGAGCSPLAASRSVSALDKRQLRSTAAGGSCGIDYSKRTLRTRNSLAKDMKAKTTLTSTLKRAAGATPHFLRTTAVSLLGGAPPTRSRSSGAVAAGNSSSSASQQQQQHGNRKPTKPERLAAAAAAFSAAAQTHAINLRSRQIDGGQLVVIPAKASAVASNAAAGAVLTTLHTPVYRRERRSLRSLAAASKSGQNAKEANTPPTTNFSKSTRLQSSAGSALAAPPPSPKLINAAAAVAAATRARSLLAKTAAAVISATVGGGGGGGSSSAAAAAGVYSKRWSLRSSANITSSAVCALRSRGTRKLKR